MISKSSRRLDITMGWIKVIFVLEIIAIYGLVIWGVEKLSNNNL